MLLPDALMIGGSGNTDILLIEKSNIKPMGSATTTHTFSQNVGSATAGRVVHFAVGVDNDGALPQTMTINGHDLYLQEQFSMPGVPQGQTGVYAGPVPTGSDQVSCSITLLSSSALIGCAVAVKNQQDANVPNTNWTYSDEAPSHTMNVSNGGIVVCSYSKSATGTSSYTPTNMIELFDYASGGYQWSGAYGLFHFSNVYPNSVTIDTNASGSGRETLTICSYR